MKEKFAANNINFVYSQSNSSGVGNFFRFGFGSNFLDRNDELQWTDCG
jgi:hypothetical protein